LSLVIQGLTPLIQVYDMPASVRFYSSVLGFDMVMHADVYAIENGVELFHWCLLRREGTELMLNTAYDEGERPEVRDNLRDLAHGDTGLYFGCLDLDAAYAHVQSLGVKCAPPKAAWYGMRQLFFRDPDGYGITLQHRA
jgi:glyoxylase I family protein